MMLDPAASKWALAILAVFSVIIYASGPTARADIEVGENLCAPVHWCLPETTGESAIDTYGEVEVREGRCFPAHWCLPGTTSEESTAFVLSPPSGTTPLAAQIVGATPGERRGRCTTK